MAVTRAEQQRAARAADPEPSRRATRKYYAKNPEYFRNKRLLAHFGITAGEYDELLAAQGGVCVICKAPERLKVAGKPKRLAVEHGHHSGVVRGLVCSACNTAIAGVKDDPAVARALADYLERTKGVIVVPQRHAVALPRRYIPHQDLLRERRFREFSEKTGLALSTAYKYAGLVRNGAS